MAEFTGRVFGEMGRRDPVGWNEASGVPPLD